MSANRARAHTLNVEIASWEDGCSPLCNWCSCRQSQDEVHVLLISRYEGVCALRRKHFKLFQALPGGFSLAQPLLRQQLNVQAIPAMPRESNFLAGTGLGIVKGITACWQKHECGRSLSIEDSSSDGRVDSVSQDLCHGPIVINGVADGNP
eukprot:1145977-Pelagomonas_calceolata.AAC.2